ncbi:unnamed protein product [Rotaria sp. Silwood2]|nr:unnamed protein product [Rotaria sp. Silwood2]CAF3228477.1 unnamed protein product [Rotaria sp. Silwood2]CAF4396241.1 unnamed protein product [Rotaria sp. Silwood2]CAF4618305.1 unnamed protein product [Rotaria sp. Silwood2]
MIYQYHLQTESENSSLCYADFTIDSFREKLICVHENHQNENNVQNTIIRISLNDSSSMNTLVSGYNFYSSPKISSDMKIFNMDLLESSKYAMGSN